MEELLIFKDERLNAFRLYKKLLAISKDEKLNAFRLYEGWTSRNELSKLHKETNKRTNTSTAENKSEEVFKMIK